MIARFFRRPEFQKRFLLFLVVLGLFVYPIIHADILYMDDHARALYGYTDMLKQGRFFSHIVLVVLNASPHILNAAPLFQIMSVVILAVVLADLSIVWGYNRLSGVLALSFIVCSANFLQNLVFCFDSLTMALSLSCALAPFCLERRIKARFLRLWLFAAAFLFASLNFYQPGLNAFLVFLCLSSVFVFAEHGARRVFIRLLCYSFCTLAVLACYKVTYFLFAAKQTSAVDTYSLIHSKIVFSFPVIKSNIVFFVRLSLWVFRGALGHIFAVGTFAGLIALLCYAAGGHKWQGKERRVAVPLCIFLVTAAVLSVFGPMLLLQAPVFLPRVMMGEGVFIAFMVSFLIGRQASWQGGRCVLITLACVMLFTQMMVSFEFGNILHAQASFETRIADQVVEDIFEMSSGKAVIARVIAPYGEYDTNPPETATLVRKLPVLHKMLNIGFPAGIWPAGIWNEVLLHERGLQANAMVFLDMDIRKGFSLEEASHILSSCHYAHARARRFYNLYQEAPQDGGHIVIDFTKKCPVPS